MIDVGYDTGFSRDFGESGLLGSGRTAVGSLSTRGATTGLDTGVDADIAQTGPAKAEQDRHEQRLPERLPEQRLPERRLNDRLGPGFPQAGAVPPSPVLQSPALSGLAGHGLDRPTADLANLDLAALQALASTGEPASAIARQVADMAQGLAALADKLVGQPRRCCRSRLHRLSGRPVPHPPPARPPSAQSVVGRTGVGHIARSCGGPLLAPRNLGHQPVHCR
jgi:hypothetical protein